MNQTMFKKTLLASAISMSFASVNVIAAPDQLEITSMNFSGDIYSAGGFFNSAGTVGPFDPAVDLVVVPGAIGLGGGTREQAPGFDPINASGNIYSFDNFFGNPWEGAQETTYLTNKDSWAFVYDKAASPSGDPCSAPVGVTKSSGPCSLQGSYDYDNKLSKMDPNQVGIGMFFQWSGNIQISVLEIFTCDANDQCKGKGVKMENGPFSGSIALFNPGLSCSEADLFIATGIDTSVSIDIAAGVLAGCKNPTAADPTNPAGLGVVSVVSPTAGGGTAIINGTVIDYSPLGGFEGSDSFVINITDGTGDTTAVTYSLQVGGQLQNNFTMLDVSGGIIGGTNDVDIVWDGTFSNPAVLPGSVDADGFGIPADTISVMTIASPTPFKGFNWFAKNVRVYQGPVKLRFDIACTEDDYINNVSDCSASPLPPENIGERYIKMELKAGQTGAHMIFDWGKSLPSSTCGIQNCDIDVINVWLENEVWPDDIRGDGRNELYTGAVGVPPKFDTTWDLISIALTPGAVIGTPMIDGAFKGSNANFNYKPLEADFGDQRYAGTIPATEAGSSMSLMSLLASLFSLFGFRRLVNRKTKQQ